MDKKNTLLLTVIAIATLLVAVVGATFAYFATGTGDLNNLSVTANTAPATGAFSATGGSLALSVSAAQMAQTEVGNTIEATTDDANDLVVSYKGGANTGCTYNVEFVWNANATNGYTKTTGAGQNNEFTITVVGTPANANSVASDRAETQVATTVKMGGQDFVLENQKIYTTTAIGAEDNAITNKYRVTLKMYNLSHDQALSTDSIAGISAAGHLGVVASSLVC